MSKFKSPARAARRPGHVRVALRDLGLAPENLRFDEPADDGVAQLADTILAAGVVIPPIVRPGTEGEQAFMALDGRRRRMALLLLRDRGDIDDRYEVDCVLARDRAARAAAVVLANSERAPVHVADIVLAIGKLRASGMDTRSIAAALGYGEIEVRRLEALAAVRPKVICALRLGKITLRQAKLFARLPDPAQQDDLAQAALDGHLHEYQLRNLVDGEASTLEDARLTLVGAERYGRAGGRIESDLFGELPDRLLDTALLERLWRERVEALRSPLEAQGLAVYISDGQGFRARRLRSCALRLHRRSAGAGARRTGCGQRRGGTPGGAAGARGSEGRRGAGLPRRTGPGAACRQGRGVGAAGRRGCGDLAVDEVRRRDHLLCRTVA